MTYIGIIVLILTAIVTSIVIISARAHVNKVALENITICQDIKCVIKVIKRFMKTKGCGERMLIEGYCRIVHIYRSLFELCCGGECVLINQSSCS